MTWIRISLCAVFLYTGCTASPDQDVPSVPTAEVSFDHPQAIRYIDGYLVVTNSGYHPLEWQPGSIVFINEDGREVHRLVSSRLNPQQILVDDDYIYIINTGTYDFSDFSMPRPGSPGSIDRIRRRSVSSAQLEVDHLDFGDHPTFISPVDGAILNKEMILTSGLLSGFIKIDLKTFRTLGDTVFYDDEGAIGLGSISAWNHGYVIADFNQDRLTFLDPSGQLVCQKDAGDEANTLEGATSPRVYGDRLYVTLSLAGVIKTMPLNSNDPCEGNLRDRVSPLGQVPNDVLVGDDYLWVVHSGDNVVTGYPQHADGDPVELLCPVGSNPWHMALHPNGREIAVTEWKGQGVTIFDLETGDQRRLAAEPIP